MLLSTGKVDPNLKGGELGELPKGWEIVLTPNGFAYYVNLYTRKTTWLDPRIQNPKRDDQTPLSIAAKYGHEKVVRLLLNANGIDTDSKDRRDRTPLSYAAENGYEAVIELLLKTGGVDPNSKDISDRTPLSYAAENGHHGIAKLLLLEKEVDPDSSDSSGQTPLLLAARGGHNTVIETLLATDAIGTKSKNAYEKVLLLWAAENGQDDTVKRLLDKGINPDMRNDDGRTPLSLAAAAGHASVVKVLLAVNGIDADSKDIKDSQTSLSKAAENGHEAVVKLLIANGADPDSRDNSCRTPLSYAVENGHSRIVQLLWTLEVERRYFMAQEVTVTQLPSFFSRHLATSRISAESKSTHEKMLQSQEAEMSD